MSASRALYRGTFHTVSGFSISAAVLLLPKDLFLLELGILTLTFVAFDLIRLRVRAANRWFFRVYPPAIRRSERARLTGASYLLIGSLITVVLFERDIAAIALSFVAIGDPVAGVIGRHFGTRRLFGKSLEGDLSCLAACVVLGLIYHYTGLSVSLLSVLVSAVGATAVEAISLPVDDNLTMPLFAGALMTVMQLL